MLYLGIHLHVAQDREEAMKTWSFRAGNPGPSFLALQRQPAAAERRK